MRPEIEDHINEFSDRIKQNRAHDHSDYLRNELLRDWSPDEAALIRSELVNELQRHERYEEAERLLLEEIERQQHEPYPWISLAEHFHYYDIRLQRSIECIAIAIEKAREDGKFLYQALGVQARLAIEISNWSLLEETLNQLAAYKHKAGDVDVFPETDFLKRIPHGAVSSEIISAYESRVAYLRSIRYSTLSGRQDGNS